MGGCIEQGAGRRVELSCRGYVYARAIQKQQQRQGQEQGRKGEGRRQRQRGQPDRGGSGERQRGGWQNRGVLPRIGREEGKKIMTWNTDRECLSQRGCSGRRRRRRRRRSAAAAAAGPEVVSAADGAYVEVQALRGLCGTTAETEKGCCGRSVRQLRSGATLAAQGRRPRWRRPPPDGARRWLSPSAGVHTACDVSHASVLGQSVSRDVLRPLHRACAVPAHRPRQQGVFLRSAGYCGALSPRRWLRAVQCCLRGCCCALYAVCGPVCSLDCRLFFCRHLALWFSAPGRLTFPRHCSEQGGGRRLTRRAYLSGDDRARCLAAAAANSEPLALLGADVRAGGALPHTDFLFGTAGEHGEGNFSDTEGGGKKEKEKGEGWRRGHVMHPAGTGSSGPSCSYTVL